MHTSKNPKLLKEFKLRDHLNYRYDNKDIKTVKFDNAF